MSKNEKLINLIKTAMNGRTQKSFAQEAGISPYNLSKIMQGKNDCNVSKNTLKRISEASGGRVSEIELLAACGYKTESADENLTPENAVVRAKEYAELIANNASVSIGRTLYASIDVFMNQILLESGLDPTSFFSTRFSVVEEHEYNGSGYGNAEKYVLLRVLTTQQDFDMSMPAILFFAKTEKGSIIPLAYETSLGTLLKFEHPDAGRKLFELADEGDVTYTDYPHVYSCRKHVAGEAEIRLLKAIFGEDAVSPGKDKSEGN